MKGENTISKNQDIDEPIAGGGQELVEDSSHHPERLVFMVVSIVAWMVGFAFMFAVAKGSMISILGVVACLFVSLFSHLLVCNLPLKNILHRGVWVSVLFMYLPLIAIVVFN